MNPAPETQAADTPARMPANNPKRGETNNVLPRFLQDLLSTPPTAGSGFHLWMFNCSKYLAAFRDEADIIALLFAKAEGCGRHVPATEILAAVRDGAAVGYKPGEHPAHTTKQAPKWPVLDVTKRNTIIADRFTLADLWEASPIPCTQDSTDVEFFIDALFPGNPLLCVGMDMRTFTTAPRESFRGKLGGMSLIVPSPMSALLGKKKNPKPDEDPLSPHTLDNTGPRRYLVTEFDSGTLDEQAALIWHLRQFAPLVLVLWSGSKSIHAWWDCEGIGEEVTGRFFRYAVTLGADSKIWTRSQFVRLPQGWRADKQRRQEVYYFNPNGGKDQTL